MTGRPTSSNGASSFRLTWVLDVDEPLVEVSAVLEILVPPAVDDLYFWALQIGFADRGARLGAAHLGLQWNECHPGHTAVNWGGYAPSGDLLPGTESTLPSAPHDPNTRDYSWEPGRPYRLRICQSPGQPGHWQGEVTDLVDGAPVVVRQLQGGGDRLTGPMVWSEVFARCDDPAVSVRWSELRGIAANGERVTPAGLAVNYQDRADGGCDNTTVSVDDRGVVQATNSERLTAGGSIVPLSIPGPSHPLP